MSRDLLIKDWFIGRKSVCYVKAISYKCRY